MLKTPNPYDDPLVDELLDSQIVNQFVRVQFLRAAAAMLEQAMTVRNPDQETKLEKLYETVMGMVQEEVDRPFVRVYLGDREIWPDDADEYTAEGAPFALRALLVGRTVGTKGRVEHHDGDRYNLVEAYEVTTDGVRMTERRKPG